MASPDPTQPTATERNVALVFIFSLVASACLLLLAYIAWDVHLYTTAPDGTNTISWSMALIGYDQPIVAFGCGVLLGGLFGFFGALAVHFWFGVGSVAEWAEVVAGRQAIAEVDVLHAEISQLQAQLAGRPPA